MAVPGRR